MDIISHGLWGGIVLGRKKPGYFIWASIFSLLPDVLGEGIMFSFIFLGLDNMPALNQGHPDITDFPRYAQNFYNASHSLIIFLLLFAIVWLVKSKAFLPLFAWGLHILIDIPTHSFELFPTPFLWPASDFKINGMKWDSPVILIVDFTLLITLYTFWFYRRKVKNKPVKVDSGQEN